MQRSVDRVSIPLRQNVKGLFPLPDDPCPCQAPSDMFARGNRFLQIRVYDSLDICLNCQVPGFARYEIRVTQA